MTACGHQSAAGDRPSALGRSTGMLDGTSGGATLSFRATVALLPLLHGHVSVQHAAVLDGQAGHPDVALDRAGPGDEQPFPDTGLSVHGAPHGKIACLHLGPDGPLAFDAQVPADCRFAL